MFEKKGIACANCGYVGAPKTAVKGSFLLEVVLWFCFIIPGLIYSIWRSTSRHKACPACGNTHLVPIDSPNGKKLLESSGKTAAQVTEEIKKTTMPLWQKTLMWVGIIFVALVILPLAVGLLM